MKSQTVTYSPSLTITLTHDCPWHCSYCGFRTDKEGLISEKEVEKKLEVARKTGAREILLISGERPGQMPHIRKALEEWGFESFIDFAVSVADQVLQAGFLPHGNYGALSRRELEHCREVHPSMGLMLENVRDLPELAPEKRSAARLATIRAAGEAKVPFTSGILIGLGEPEESRFESLEALVELHHQYGHLQEIILQNYLPNQGSRLGAVSQEVGLQDYLELIFFWRDRCPDVAVQVPPNLNPFWKELLPVIDDLGGISTEPDEVNRIHRWADLETYKAGAEEAGVRLEPRAAVYESFIQPEWLSPRLWGEIGGGQRLKKVGLPRPVSRFRGRQMLWRDALWKLSTSELTEGAREYRERRFGKRTTFVVNRNANFTNICNVGCTFCGFARKRSDGDAYVESIDAIVERLSATPGITETCLQGGIHPDLGWEYYRDLLVAIREALPALHIHAFSPMEIHSLHLKTGWDYDRLLASLQEAGLDTMPGTAAEILDDRVRKEISGNKLTSAQWEEIIRTAHGLGIRSTATIMYGHVETWEDIRGHFEKLLRIQEATGGFTELVPLAFIPYKNRLGKRLAEKGVHRMEAESRERARRLYPLARLFFTDSIEHLQTSWVKLGIAGAVESLNWGCDDFGGTLFEESITRESGGRHGECLEPTTIRQLLSGAGYEPVERTTLYHLASRQLHNEAQTVSPD